MTRSSLTSDVAMENTPDEQTLVNNPPAALSSPLNQNSTESTEMTTISRLVSSDGAVAIPVASSNPASPTEASSSELNPQPIEIQKNQGLPSKTNQAAKPIHEPTIGTSANTPDSPKHPSPHTFTREKTGSAMGPSSDQPILSLKEMEFAGPILLITLLLTTGARHPFRIDEKYLARRNVKVDGSSPINMSVYTLKELVWREWRDDWEPRPSSPSSIRLIYYGKLLEDKSRLQDCRFETGLIPHVVHMTIKPQDIVDEEDAKMAKAGSRDREGSERSTGCRCTIL